MIELEDKVKTSTKWLNFWISTISYGIPKKIKEKHTELVNKIYFFQEVGS